MSERVVGREDPRGRPTDTAEEGVAGAQGALAVDPGEGSRRLFNPLPLVVRALPPIVVFVLILLIWQFAIRPLGVPEYSLPTPSKIIQTIPTIGELTHDAAYTALQEALPGFLLGSALGFLFAIAATFIRIVAKGVMPYAVVSNSIPIIAMAPVAIAVFGSDWQSKVAIVTVITFFPMLVNAYRGLTSVDPLSLQLMRSYAAGGWTTFFKLRLPASLPYVFNGLKINTTLAMIGAIIGEYFGSPAYGLGFYIHYQGGETGHTPELWSAVTIACVIGIAAYTMVVILERLLTFWHISYRSGR
jgi:NitT/TauT family transport system permease protein